MKKVIKKLLIALAVIVVVFFVLLFLAFTFKPLGDVVFSVTMGSMYHKAGETVLKTAGNTETLAIYKADNKPFLIVGPRLFHEGEDYEDFFFVNKDQVIRTATDKGGDTWVRLFKRLFIYDDMTAWDRVRMPYWDDLKCDKDSSVRWDKATDSYLYSFKIHSVTIPVSFAIPAKLLTPDMLDAPNDTRAD